MLATVAATVAEEALLIAVTDMVAAEERVVIQAMAAMAIIVPRSQCLELREAEVEVVLHRVTWVLVVVEALVFMDRVQVAPSEALREMLTAEAEVLAV